MGLDMYLHKVRKLNEKEIKSIIGKTIDEALDVNYDIAIWRADEKMDSNLLPYSCVVKLKADVLEEDRLMKENGIPNDAVVGGYEIGEDEIELSFKYKENDELKHKDVKLSRKEFEGYFHYDEQDCYVCFMEEIGYWRKDYDLRDEIHYMLGEVDNCQYKKVTEELRDYLEKTEEQFGGELKCGEDEAFFYYEWY